MGNADTAVAEAVSVIDYVIGENVDTLRKRRGFTNETLGAKFGVTGPAISLKLRGRRAWSAADVKFAADLLGVRMGVLYGEEPMPEPGADINVTSIASRPRKRALKQRSQD
jgi:transcriptional regulator with XRE-family HTH domain